MIAARTVSVARAFAAAALLTVVVSVFVSGATETETTQSEQVFWTSEALEPDTIASAWLLERFAAPGCRIVLLPRGQRLSVGTPFDLPLVALSRTRTQSTFHVIRQSFGLTDQRLGPIERLVDDVEISAWNATPPDAAIDFAARLRAIASAAASPAIAMREGGRFLDELYETNVPQE